MKFVKPIISTIFFIAIAYLSFHVVQKSLENQRNKIDYAELHNFKYGLFSVDAWKEQLSVIISDEIDKLSLTRSNEKTLRAHLEVQLGVLIDKVMERIEQKNKETLKGKFKLTLMDSFIDVKDIKKGIPGYADAMMKEMTTSRTENQVKKMLKNKINGFIKETYDVKDDSKKDIIIQETGIDDEQAAISFVDKTIFRLNAVIVEYSIIIVALCVLMFIIQAIGKAPISQAQYIILTLTLIILLIVGVTTPMIDMEAKISQLDFVLFDHPIHFENQVLYFQSKSVLDVFWIMITHKEIQMKAVGLLMVGFSIVFPIIKMTCSVFYFYYPRYRDMKWIQFFVLKSGKWSMADVMVVAIFMAFIGFNGILNTQLNQLKMTSEELGILTTNGTSLQPGFYLFLTYVILAMFLSGFIQKKAVLEATGPAAVPSPS